MSDDDIPAPDIDDASDDVPVGPADEFGADVDDEPADFGDAEEFGDGGYSSEPVGPSGWRPPEPTGVQVVDEAVEPLTELDELPTAEHVAYYETAHRRLQDALADLDGA